MMTDIDRELKRIDELCDSIVKQAKEINGLLLCIGTELHTEEILQDINKVMRGEDYATNQEER